jgi:hypothetical protein
MATSLAVAGNASAQKHLTAVIPRHLDSWKEIAAFFGRTIRTVQRWETAENLPVYHHIHVKRCSVYALESELICWRDARSRQQHVSHLSKKSLTRRLRLAVLPFANLSADPQLRHFEDGLTYEIIAIWRALIRRGLALLRALRCCPTRSPAALSRRSGGT